MPVMPRPNKANKIVKKMNKGKTDALPQKDYSRSPRGDPSLEKEVRRMIKR